MTRREAREAVFELLFEMEFRGGETAEEIYATSAENRELPDDGYVKTAYFTVCEQLSQIDDMIGEHAHGWKTSRMSRVSRAILRIGVYELMFNEDIPANVTINEAVELAKKYDDEKARPFINGVLNSVKNALQKA